MTKVVLAHFQDVYNSAPVQDIDDCIAIIPKLVTDNMNTKLTKPISDSKIRKAVFSMGALKAPGSDGLNGSFYQKHWEVVGRQVCTAVTEFFQNGILPNAVNETQVVLVPKIQRPESVSHYRPISCCNFIYKVITRILVLRLRTFMNSLIGQNQNAFIKGRLIQDNIMITHEILHALNQLYDNGKNSFIAKLDMSKAYDRLEWDFI